jgi:ATP-dependent RNA helicase DDX18/HAS1
MEAPKLKKRNRAESETSAASSSFPGDKLVEVGKRQKKKKESKDESIENHSADIAEIGCGIEEQAVKEQAEVDAVNESSTGSTTIFSTQCFNDLPLLDKTKLALKNLGFTKMTQIQAKSIPECLAGSDLIGAAKTGSGKTLSFLVPIIELLVKVQFTRKQGTGAIIISPTRELSLQIYGVLRDVMEAAEYPQTHGLVMGGANRKAEADRLVKGVNILVSTPGRLLDHLMNTTGFNFQRLQVLVIDEADRILEQGFEEDMHKIIKVLPKERQTILFSATQTRKVEDLARLSIRGTPVYAGVHDADVSATVQGLQQGYVVCPAEKRFMLLYTFLRKNKNKKIMVSIRFFVLPFAYSSSIDAECSGD